MSDTKFLITPSGRLGVVIDRDLFLRELQARGWDFNDLIREAKVGSNTIAKINRGEAVRPSVRARIIQALAATPPSAAAVNL